MHIPTCAIIKERTIGNGVNELVIESKRNALRRALAAVLILSFAPGVFGCNKKEKVSETTAEETQETTEATEKTEETTEATTEETEETVKKPAADNPEEVNDQIANPWREVTEKEFIEIMGEPLMLPKDAFISAYRVCDSDTPLGEVDFFLYYGNTTITARVQKTNKLVDISGLYYEWTEFNYTCGEISVTDRAYSDDESAVQSSIWYDTDTGCSYSLSIVSDDLDGFDLGALTEQMIAARHPEGINALPDNEEGFAYKNAIYYFANTGELPDGSMTDNSNCKFAVADIDHDGHLELIIYVLGKTTVSKMCYIFKYVRNETFMKRIFTGYPSIRVLTNGDILENWSHNKGPGEMWPFNIYINDPNGEYQLYATVDSWNKEGNEVFRGEEYPDWADVEGAGVVYSVQFADTGEYLGDSMYVSKSKYDDFFAKEAGEANEIELDFFTV